MFTRMDEEAFEELDAAEKMAYKDSEVPHLRYFTSPKRTAVPPSPNKASTKIRTIDLITIEDNDEEHLEIKKESLLAKEKHTKWRPNRYHTGTDTLPSQGVKQRKRPVVLDISPAAIIDISDSD